MALFQTSKAPEVKYTETPKGRVKNGFTLFHVISYKEGQTDLNQNFLSAYDGRKADGILQLVKAGHKGKLFMDSGAFVAQKKNIELDIDKYIAYVNEIGEHLFAIAQMDYLPRRNDGGAVESTAISSKKTWENFLYMWDKVKPELRSKLIYIVHGDEEFSPLLEKACAWRDKDGQKIQYMGIGLAGGDVESRVRAAKQVAATLHSCNYEGQFHGFGVQTPEVLEVLPFATSADSSTAIRDAAAGRIYLDGKLLKMPNDSKIHHVTKYSRQYYDNIEPHFKARAAAVGIDYEEALKNSYTLYKWNCIERSKYIEKMADDKH